MVHFSHCKIKILIVATILGWAWWLKFVVLATWEEETEKIMAPGEPEKKFKSFYLK
jgi:hypothetical protein